MIISSKKILSFKTLRTAITATLVGAVLCSLVGNWAHTSLPPSVWAWVGAMVALVLAASYGRLEDISQGHGRFGYLSAGLAGAISMEAVYAVSLLIAHPFTKPGGTTVHDAFFLLTVGAILAFSGAVCGRWSFIRNTSIRF